MPTRTWLRETIAAAAVCVLVAGACGASPAAAADPEVFPTAPGAAAYPPLGTRLFPGLSGAELQDSLRVHYRPPIGLSYGDARDVMFSQIDNDSGTVTGIYTGFSVHVNPSSSNPRGDAFAAGLNTEHTWPQSKGAGNLPARADLHHLFPSEINANGARASYPFEEIPDEETDLWYRLRQVTATPDTLFLDDYSELDRSFPGTSYEGRWEPREKRKGDVARAMFYFYTMYRSEADVADPNYFAAQKTDLRAWNEADPVDEREYARTCAIAAVQADRVNPFVVDPTLAGRAYFGEVPVRLAYFRARTAETGVELVWETTSDSDPVGFDVLRGARGAWTRCNRDRIVSGPSYSFLDRTGEPGIVYEYWIEALTRDGSRRRYGPRRARFPTAAVAVSVRPNPARVGETVRFQIGSPESATAELFDATGRRLRTWDNARELARGWTGELDSGKTAEPGVYFFRLKAGSESRMLRLVLIR